MATTTGAKPTKLKPKKYDKRPPSHFESMHEHVRNNRPSAVHEIVRFLTLIINIFVFRTKVIGMRHVWRRGGWIMAPVHFSNYDHFLCAQYTPRRGKFMAKSNMFIWPLSWILPSGGTFPAVLKEDKKPDWEPLRTARIVLSRNEALYQYCWGGRNRGEDLPSEGKFGIGWLALETGAWIVPVAIYGSEHIRDIVKIEALRLLGGKIKIPRKVRIKRPPKITVEYGRPFRLEKKPNPTPDQSKQAANEINARLVALQRNLEARKGKRRTRISFEEKWDFIFHCDAQRRKAVRS